MSEIVQQLIGKLNHQDVNIRLESLRQLSNKLHTGEIISPDKKNDVNNHIHTTFSFSPYSPAKAVWMAYCEGLATAGIMDHDSISGAVEFIEAGKIIGISTTIGIECRADFSSTFLKDKRINNPDQNSIGYVAIHGIPHTQIDIVKQFFAPYSIERNKRNRKMVEKLNHVLNKVNIHLDFDKDIEPLSMSQFGGSITERHILYALSIKLIDNLGKGPQLVEFIKQRLNISINPNVNILLQDINNLYYEYDLLGLLKSEMVSSFYIDATAECPDIREIVALAKSIGAISAYAYLGDVGDSVTGDKKTQKFEDDYIEDLFQVLKQLDFNAVTYMPSRNRINQLQRVMSLCEKHGLFQISGEDINSPRQSFVCKAMRGESFQHLIDSTWALIGHEKESTINKEMGMFSREILNNCPDLDMRIAHYKKIGLK